MLKSWKVAKRPQTLSKSASADSSRLRTSRTIAGADVTTVVGSLLALAVAFGLFTPEQAAEVGSQVEGLALLAERGIAALLALVSAATQLFKYLRLAVER